MKVNVRAMPYWPEIDGLRTIAVLSVYLFHLHLNPLFLPGGFVGVDVFFVISGFLIASLLVLDFDSGHFSLLRFYQRRIARIAPASFFVLGLTMIVGRFVYSAQDFALLGVNGAAAALSAINIQLLSQGNYFQTSPDAQPLLHYWSLSVEEQFYVSFPLVLFLTLRFTTRPIYALSLYCALSYVGWIVATRYAPTAAFYLLPTRAWELLAGACLALARQRGFQFSLSNARHSFVAGIALLFISFLWITPNSFSGWVAAVPVLATVLLLASLEKAPELARKALANSAMVFIGKRSYSLYLWHWPVFSFVDYQFYCQNVAVRLALKIGISCGATFLTYQLLENPMRTWLNSPRWRLSALGAFGLAMVALFVTGIAIRSTYYLSASPQSIATGGIPINSKAQRSVVLIGDSQGVMYGYELASLARSLDFALYNLSVTGTNELPGEYKTLWPEVERFLENRTPDVVVLAGRWSVKLWDPGAVEHLREGLHFLTQRARQVLVLAEPPWAPSVATREGMRDGARPPFFEDRVPEEKRLQINATLRAFESRRVRILDIADLLQAGDASIIVIDSRGRLTFHDRGHLSDAGTTLVRPRLQQALSEAFLND